MSDGISGFVEKIYEQYGKEYLSWFLAMCSSPRLIVEKTRAAKLNDSHSTYLLNVLILSIFIGATIGALIPNRPDFPLRVVVFLTVAILWGFLGLLVSWFCRLLGGTESTDMSMSLMMQDLAFAYVVSNFLTLIIVWMDVVYEPLGAFRKSQFFLAEPGAILFSVQFVTLFFLVPLTVAYAHGFRGYKWFLVGAFSALFSILFGFPVYAQHSC